MFDGKAFGEEIVGIVKGYVDQAVAPLRAENEALAARVAELEARPAPEPIAPDLSGVAQRAEEVLARLVPAMGFVTTEELTAFVGKAVAEAAASLPAPQDGKSVTAEEIAPLIAEEVGKAVAALPPPEPGKDADPALVERLVADKVTEAVAALPAPQDGKSVTIEDVAPLIADQVGKAVAELPAPLSVRSVVVDRDGHAVFTFSDGSTQDVGRVVGTDADMAAIERQLREMVAAIPKPRDGFSLDDFDIEAGEDGRTVTMKFQQGETVHSYELVFPVVLDRGVFKAGEQYVAGDAVTWGGSLWVAQRATGEKPDSADSGWRLAVKKGRDGKDAK